MISLTIWLCLWSTFFVLAPPSGNINQRRSLESITSMTLNESNMSSKMLIKRRKLNRTRTRTTTTISTTTTTTGYPLFDINSYRSSWKFVDKHTVRVRFRLWERLLSFAVSTQFLVRHTTTGHLQTYDKPHETMNSTLTLYLQNIKHGRHTVCLLIYTTKLMKTPRRIFCQDIIFNFHKYGHHDIDSDEYRNTFFFLLTQYAIVLGILCILQLVHAGRKRRFLAAVYEKANAIRHLMTEHHRHTSDNKPSLHIRNRKHGLDYLIYNYNRNALDNFDQMYMQTTNGEDDVISPLSNFQRANYDRYLKLPNRMDEHAKTSLTGHNRQVTTTTTTSEKINFDEDNFDDSDFDTRSCEEQSVSFKSLSHILEANKPWMSRLSENGSIKHSILSSMPLHDTKAHVI